MAKFYVSTDSTSLTAFSTYFFSRKLQTTIMSATSPKVTKPKKKTEKKTTGRELVEQALVVLKQPKGVSVTAIKKQIAQTQGDSVKPGTIKRAVIQGLKTGAFVQAKGVGAAGSIRLAKKEPKKAVKKATTPKKAVKKAAAKKSTPKKTAPKTKKATPKKPKAKKPAAKKPAAKKPAAKKPAAKKPVEKKSGKCRPI